MSAFLDTNVLVYLFDNDAPEKKARARELFESLARRGELVLSTQVLQEFFVAVTRKLAMPLDPQTAEEVVRELAELPIVQVDEAMILAAIARHRQHGFSFWDALIIQAAIDSGAQRLLTEDLQHGREIDGLKMENPFL